MAAGAEGAEDSSEAGKQRSEATIARRAKPAEGGKKKGGSKGAKPPGGGSRGRSPLEGVSLRSRRRGEAPWGSQGGGAPLEGPKARSRRARPHLSRILLYKKCKIYQTKMSCDHQRGEKFKTHTIESQV